MPVYNSVNVTSDPELKERLLNGELNVGICKKCGTRHVISVPVLYHDMDLKFMVWVLPREWHNLEVAAELERHYHRGLAQTRRETPGKVLTGYTFGVLWGTDELRKTLDVLSGRSSAQDAGAHFKILTRGHTMYAGETLIPQHTTHGRRNGPHRGAVERAPFPHAAATEARPSSHGRPEHLKRHLVRPQNGLSLGGPSVTIRKPDDVLATAENLE